MAVGWVETLRPLLDRCVPEHETNDLENKQNIQRRLVRVVIVVFRMKRRMIE